MKDNKNITNKRKRATDSNHESKREKTNDGEFISAEEQLIEYQKRFNDAGNSHLLSEKGHDAIPLILDFIFKSCLDKLDNNVPFPFKDYQNFIFSTSIIGMLSISRATKVSFLKIIAERCDIKEGTQLYKKLVDKTSLSKALVQYKLARKIQLLPPDEREYFDSLGYRDESTAVITKMYVSHLKPGDFSDEIINSLMERQYYNLISDDTFDGLSEKQRITNFPLHFACARDDVAKVKILLSKENINKQDEYGATPLLWAVKNKSLKVTKLLLKQKGIDVNHETNSAESALSMVCYQDDTSIAKMLLEHPEINVNITTSFYDSDDISVLGLAVYHRNFELVKLLLKCDKLDVNQEFEPLFDDAHQQDTTPLLLACTLGFVEVFKLLLNHPSIDINKADLHGATPLYRVCENDNIDFLKLLLAKKEIVIDKLDNQLRTILYAASISSESNKLFEYLINQTEIDFTKTKNGQVTPIYPESYDFQIYEETWDYPFIQADLEKKELLLKKYKITESEKEGVLACDMCDVLEGVNGVVKACRKGLFNMLEIAEFYIQKKEEDPSLKGVSRMYDARPEDFYLEDIRRMYDAAKEYGCDKFRRFLFKIYQKRNGGSMEIESHSENSNENSFTFWRNSNDGELVEEVENYMMMNNQLSPR